MTSRTADASAAYAAQVARLLWPGPAPAPYVTRRRRRIGQSHRDFYLFPSARRPRLLLPADASGSSSMIQRLGAGHSPLMGPAFALLELSVRSRAFSLTHWPILRVPMTEPQTDSIERHLSDCFETEVRFGVLLGTRRVNQKPVLQIFDLQGRLKGYAKVGHTDLTAELVRREAAALRRIGAQQPRSFRVPKLLHHGQWSGLEVLVMSPLSTSPRPDVTRSLRFAAMREVAEPLDTSSTPLIDSGFWHRLCHDAEVLAEQPDGARLGAAARTLEERYGADPVPLGGWHGDWGAWNMGMGSGVLQVWDWERYDSEVPLGFDALHFEAQNVRPGDPAERKQEETFLRSVPQTLSAMGNPPETHDVTLCLYLLEIAVRYVEALRHGATSPLRKRTSWAISLLERLSKHPEPALSKGLS